MYFSAVCISVKCQCVMDVFYRVRGDNVYALTSFNMYAVRVRSWPPILCDALLDLSKGDQCDD